MLHLNLIWKWNGSTVERVGSLGQGVKSMIIFKTAQKLYEGKIPQSATEFFTKIAQ